MTLPGLDNRTAHALKHLAIQQVTVDCFTLHEGTYLLVGRMKYYEGHISSFANKRNQIQSFKCLSEHNL